MVFPYYPRPEDDEQEPTEEQQPEASQPAIPSYLYDVFACMGEDLSLLYPPKPTSDEGYVTPGKPHTLPSGPTTHQDPPISNDTVTLVPPSPSDQSLPSRDQEDSDKDAVSQNGGQSALAIAQDIEWENSTKLDDLTGFLQLAANADLAAPAFVRHRGSHCGAR